MKKNLLLILATMTALCGRAQEGNADNIFSIIKFDSITFKTILCYDENMGKYYNESPRIQAGSIKYCSYFSSEDCLPIGFTMPDDPNAYFSMTDVEGISTEFPSDNFSDYLTKLQYGNGHHFTGIDTHLLTGGKYRWNYSIPFLGMKMEDTLTVYDVPCMHTCVLSKYKLNKDTEDAISYNTGYPYEDTFTGEEWAKCTIYAVDSINGQLTKLSENKIELTFKKRYNVNKAVVDTLLVTMPTGKVGKYLMRLESNWEPGNRDMYFEVYDPDTGISRTTRDKRDSSEKYTMLYGTRTDRPATPGIYIRGKKKVIVK